MAKLRRVGKSVLTLLWFPSTYAFNISHHHTPPMGNRSAFISILKMEIEKTKLPRKLLKFFILVLCSLISLDFKQMTTRHQSCL